MKNNLSDVNNYLFEELETLSNYKDVKTKKLLLESLIKFKRSKR